LGRRSSNPSLRTDSGRAGSLRTAMTHPLSITLHASVFGRGVIHFTNLREASSSDGFGGTGPAGRDDDSKLATGSPQLLLGVFDRVFQILEQVGEGQTDSEPGTSPEGNDLTGFGTGPGGERGRCQNARRDRCAVRLGLRLLNLAL
jgi:hypothetical protein